MENQYLQRMGQFMGESVDQPVGYSSLHASTHSSLDSSARSAAEKAPVVDFSIDELLHQRTRTLSKKMEVFTLEILVRLDILRKNSELLDEEKHRVETVLQAVSRKVNYLMAMHSDKSPFYEQLFKLEEERRHQNVECWQDIVMVMRDLLMAWEAHAQAKARGLFLENV